MQNNHDLKTLVFYVFLIPNLFAGGLLSQTGLESIDVYADVRANGRLGKGYYAFNYPKNSTFGYFHSPSLWLSAEDDFGMEFLSARTFEQSGTDFQPGPIMNHWEYASQLQKWNKTWHLTKAQIDYHRLHFQDFQYIVPAEIKDWPAMGDPSLGQAMFLAPFQDVNQNGIYDPKNGDYPKIKGDECIFFIYNDDRIHSESNGTSLQAEIHGMLYVFNCNQHQVLQRTVFSDYKIYNRSSKNYTLKTSLFSAKCNPGYLFGTDSTRNLSYQYYAYPSDSSLSQNYEKNPPSVGVMFIDSNPVHQFVYGNNFGPVGNPTSKQHYIDYQYCKDKFQNSQKDNLNHVSYHAFSGDPISQHGWNMHWNAMDSFDLRMVHSYERRFFPSNQYLFYQMAFVFASDTSDTLASLQKLKLDVDILQVLLQQGNICGQSVEKESILIKNQNFLKCLNGTIDKINIQLEENKGICYWQVFDLYGKCVMKGEVSPIEKEFSIDRTQICAGVFIVELKNDLGFVRKKCLLP